MSYWTFPTKAAADAALDTIATETGAAWDEAAQLKDGRWAFAALPDAPTPSDATTITGLAAMLAGMPKRGEPS